MRFHVDEVRDGLNLVAKEFIAAQAEAPGVLVLSDTAGVATELGDDALTVTPLDTGSFAETLRQAIEMLPRERRQRMDVLGQTVNAGHSDDWIALLFDPLAVRSVEGGRSPDEIRAIGD